jgi:thioredoxin 1
MTKPIELNDSNFDATVLKSKIPVLVDFWATWCRPCQMVAPIVDELATEYAGKITFAKMDVDHNQKTAAQFGVMSIPNLIVFKNGKPAYQVVGFKPKAELKKTLDNALA